MPPLFTAPIWTLSSKQAAWPSQTITFSCTVCTKIPIIAGYKIEIFQSMIQRLMMQNNHRDILLRSYISNGLFCSCMLTLFYCCLLLADLKKMEFWEQSALWQFNEHFHELFDRCEKAVLQMTTYVSQLL